MLALIPALRAFSRFLARDTTLADDLVQETVVRALSKAGQFAPGTNLKAWLFSILRNFFLEQARRSNRERAVLSDYAASPDRVAQSQSAAVERAAIQELDHFLWQLSPLLREALVLIGAQEMTYEDAAMICGVTVGTMKARVSRARVRLQTLTENQGGNTP
ncbi:sigma-70 family RNA polymerase sigma factor [Acetobacter farinalis]|uniref:RNA polymerase sigma factor n=1 Tax=Acetobacter farinalis TaxID=1260984 RepID=A0ABT3Q592_9PROT|nr:sigma-70 family RNA polymerase sigma factor [Acetobacter farinalis]MCX2560452.1 sigma-70 family RNA polymerase sigma factor [Acetobacter farinalis]